MFTGERILPGGKFHVTYQQSLFAYEFARKRAAGKRVLDVGSGEGYGVAYLAEAAAEVVGLDVHAGTTAQAQQKYRGHNFRFVAGSPEKPPNESLNNTFDLVVCFQTIEHVVNQGAFLELLKKFAAPGGEVVIATPNRGRFSEFNPYHIHELTPIELQELMQAHFSKVNVYGVFGDEMVLRYRNMKQKISGLILKADILHAREWLPRPLVLGLYGLGAGLVKTLSYRVAPSVSQQVTLSSFRISERSLSQALDLLAVGVVHG